MGSRVANWNLAHLLRLATPDLWRYDTKKLLLSPLGGASSCGYSHTGSSASVGSGATMPTLASSVIERATEKK